jgi:hypothetical protein
MPARNPATEFANQRIGILAYWRVAATGMSPLRNLRGRGSEQPPTQQIDRKPRNQTGCNGSDDRALRQCAKRMRQVLPPVVRRRRARTGLLPLRGVHRTRSRRAAIVGGLHRSMCLPRALAVPGLRGRRTYPTAMRTLFPRAGTLGRLRLVFLGRWRTCCLGLIQPMRRRRLRMLARVQTQLGASGHAVRPRRNSSRTSGTFPE